MSSLIVLEGIDGSGKGSQTKRLVDRLSAEGRSVRTMSFPRYTQNRFGEMISRFLAGEFGELDEVAAELAVLLFAGDRLESKPLLSTDDDSLLVLDRYVSSNMAHQAARVEGDRRAKLIEFADWLEHDLYALPRPELTVWLHVSPTVAKTNIERRAAETGRAIDIAEADIKHLTSSSAVYEQLSRSESWATVRCDDGRTMRSFEAIESDVYAAVESRLLLGH